MNFSLETILRGLNREAQNVILEEMADDAVWELPPMMPEAVRSGEDEVSPLVPTGLSPKFDIDTIKKMLRTGEIMYPLSVKKAAISSIVRSGSGFNIECASKRDKQIMEVALYDVLYRRIDEMLTMLEYGTYYGEVTYTIADPKSLGLKGVRGPVWIIDDINACDPATIDKIDITDDGNFNGYWQIQQPPYSLEKTHIGVERALVIPYNPEFGKFTGRSILEPVYVWWFWYEMIWRAYLRYMKRVSNGIVIVKFPSRGVVQYKGRKMTNLEWAMKIAQSLPKTNYVIVPSDTDPDSGKPYWSVETQNIQDARGQAFIEALKMLSQNIKDYLLSGTDEESDFMVTIDTERTLGLIAAYISRYVLPKWLMWNGSPVRRARIRFRGANSRVLPLLFKLMSIAGNTTGEALANVDWRQLFETGGVPILPEEEVETVRQRISNMPDEKAKMDRGGEGRWDSEREGLEMHDGIVLTEEQVEWLKANGYLREDIPYTIGGGNDE